MLRFARGLTKSVQKVPLKRQFGGAVSHHDDHHHEVHLDKNMTYVATKDFKNELTAIYGLKDDNFHPVEEHSDPYRHLHGKPYFSFERMYFADPYYHPDEEEQLMNDPHGYIVGEDPMDVRNLVERPGLEYFLLWMFAFSGLFFLGSLQMRFGKTGHDLYEMNLTALEIEEEIRKIRKDNHALEERLAELRKQV
eukprot:TRINITY_DN881_c0_g1_i1.p1 TRINITY_DN881_c0_g1~~TRINITY_DN881_c0_g1_i1.p1  ORF type:complete len:194 (+),score=57.06 TRINITY_DN881_c0_g1_i1:112-693(+)